MYKPLTSDYVKVFSSDTIDAHINEKKNKGSAKGSDGMVGNLKTPSQASQASTNFARASSSTQATSNPQDTLINICYNHMELNCLWCESYSTLAFRDCIEIDKQNCKFKLTEKLLAMRSGPKNSSLADAKSTSEAAEKDDVFRSIGGLMELVRKVVQVKMGALEKQTDENNPFHGETVSNNLENLDIALNPNSVLNTDAACSQAVASQASANAQINYAQAVASSSGLQSSTVSPGLQNVNLKYRPIYGVNYSIVIKQPGPRVYYFSINAQTQPKGVPWGVCCDKFGNYIVADKGNSCIKVFSPRGTMIRQFGRRGFGRGSFFHPVGVAVNPDGHIVVADKNNHRIQVFQPNGEFMFAFGRKGTEPGNFKYPWDVACDSKGNIAVTDTMNLRIQLFNKKGHFLSLYSFKTFRRSNPIKPQALCFTNDGRVIATDVKQGRLIILNSSFTFAQVTRRRDNGSKEFIQPQGIVCDDQGNIIVADSHNNSIKVFNANVQFLWEIRRFLRTVCPNSVQKPFGVCLNPNGDVAAINLSDDVHIRIY